MTLRWFTDLAADSHFLSQAAVWAPGQIVGTVQAVYDVLCQLVESLGECRVVEHQPLVMPAGVVHLPFPYAFPD